MMVTIANGMADRGVHVDLLLARASGPYLTEVSSDVDVIDMRASGVVSAIPALARHLRAARPDVLLTTLSHTSAAGLAARTLSLTGIPVVVREANTPTRGDDAWAPAKDRIARRILNQAYRAADGIMAVSDGVAAALHAVVGVPTEKIATLYNPVVTADLPRLAAENPDHPWLERGEPPVILGVGSLTQRKDFATLIRAFELVNRERDVRLVILGEGPERDGLERLANELGIQGKLAMPGFVANPFAYMSRAAVYVLSSNLEGLPGSLVQALACGCPSVATDCPSGPAEILQGGALGPLVPIGDEVAMARAITAQLDAPTPRNRLIAAVAKYDADTVLDEVLSYLTAVSSGKRRASSPQG